MAKISVEEWGKQWAVDFNHVVPLTFNNLCANFARIVGGHMRNSFREQGFEGDNGVEPWAPRKKKYAWPILNHSGQLKKSLREDARKGKGRYVARVYTDSGAFIGFNYAAFHNQPSGTYSHPYPSIQRQFVGYSSELEDRLMWVTAFAFFKVLPGYAPTI